MRAHMVSADCGALIPELTKKSLEWRINIQNYPPGYFTATRSGATPYSWVLSSPSLNHVDLEVGRYYSLSMKPDMKMHFLIFLSCSTHLTKVNYSAFYASGATVMSAERRSSRLTSW